MIRRTTNFSPCRQYRYSLWRHIDRTDDLFATQTPEQLQRREQFALFICLNPSVADENRPDPTSTRVVDFARRWGYGAVCIANLFAWVDSDPSKMKFAATPVGPDNDRHLLKLAREAGMILAAWGKDGKHQQRADTVRRMLAATGRPVHCLKLNADQSPIHPLYVPADTTPILYTL